MLSSSPPNPIFGELFATIISSDDFLFPVLRVYSISAPATSDRGILFPLSGALLWLLWFGFLLLKRQGVAFRCPHKFTGHYIGGNDRFLNSGVISCCTVSSYFHTIDIRKGSISSTARISSGIIGSLLFLEVRQSLVPALFVEVVQLLPVL